MSDPRAATGEVWPMGVPIGQSWFELGALAWLCGRHEIKSFVEIGMLEGGLSAFLLGRTMFAKDFRYLGIEYDPRFLDVKILAAAEWFDRFDIWEADAFEPDTVRGVNEWIQETENARALIYCDGGDKVKELRDYGPVLWPGDIIAAHDFGREYQESDLPRMKNMTRIESDWLTDTHIIAFEKAGS